MRAIFWLGKGWRGKAFAVLCGVTGIAFLLSVIVPYQPYESKQLEVIPHVACAGDEIGILTTREWRPTWYQNIDYVRVATQWQATDDAARYPAFTGPTFPNFEQPTGTVKADIRLPVPQTPGEYRLLLAYDIEGDILLAPRHQDVPPEPQDWIRSANTLTVKDCQ